MFLLQSTSTPTATNKRTVRTYRDDQTGSEITTYLLHKDKLGGTWWAFDDLFQIPFVRQFAAKQVIDMYGHGLSMDDITHMVNGLKADLRGTDPEKYEKAYAKVLELEELAKRTGDPVRQCMGLCTVYLLLDDERPDVYLNSVQGQKMTNMALDIDAQAFFLRWWTDIMRSSGKVLKGISAIASITTSP